MVIGTKLTGAGRYRDILAMRDAGADYIFDFVDAGLLRPWSRRGNTVVPCSVFSRAWPPLRPTSSWRRLAPRHSSPTMVRPQSRRWGRT